MGWQWFISSSLRFSYSRCVYILLARNQLFLSTIAIFSVFHSSMSMCEMPWKLLSRAEYSKLCQFSCAWHVSYLFLYHYWVLSKVIHFSQASRMSFMRVTSLGVMSMSTVDSLLSNGIYYWRKWPENIDFWSVGSSSAPEPWWRSAIPEELASRSWRW